MQPAAVLFDLDDTIYPSSCGLMQSIDVRITEYVTTLLGISADEAHALRRDYLSTYGTTLRGLLEQHRVDPEHYLAYIHDVAYEAFLASDAELDHLLTELPAVKAIFTNAPSEHARRVLQLLAIDRHFDHLFDIRFMGFRSKPDPGAYQKALEQLGNSGPEVVLIEDTPRNLPPARQLGMTTILVTRAESHPDADYVVPDVLAALRLIT